MSGAQTIARCSTGAVSHRFDGFIHPRWELAAVVATVRDKSTDQNTGEHSKEQRLSQRVA